MSELSLFPLLHTPSLICACEVLRHIFTGPSSIAPAAGQVQVGRGCNAHNHRISTVTPQMIAYAVCQVRSLLAYSIWILIVDTPHQARFMISTLESWSPDDGKFSYIDFYKEIVATFEDYPEEEWVSETLSWWQQYVLNLFFSAQSNVL